MIDSIGSVLKSNIKFESTRYLSNKEDEEKFNLKQDEIFTYKLNTKSKNYTKYKDMINLYQQTNHNFPTIHIGEQGQEQLDLIELFDVFLGIKEDSSIWSPRKNIIIFFRCIIKIFICKKFHKRSNPKKYTSMWIESSNDIFVDLK